MYFGGPLHMDEQRQDDQIQDTGCSPEDLLEACTIGRDGERGSGISVLMAQHDDEDDDIYMYVYIYI